MAINSLYVFLISLLTFSSSAFSCAHILEGGWKKVPGFDSIFINEKGQVWRENLRTFEGPFYVRGETLFSDAGWPVMGFKGDGYWVNMHGIERYYPKTDVVIRRAGNWSDVGVSPDGYLCAYGVKGLNHGQGFYIHKDKLYDRDGHIVTSVEVVGTNKLFYKYSR